MMKLFAKFTVKAITAMFAVTLFVILQTVKVEAALSGAYTIDSSQAASSGNYRDFVSAVSDLKTGTRSDGGTPNGSGVSGPVVFNVAAGIYAGQLDLTAITGVSATNTIRFDGGFGNASTCIVTAAGSAALPFTIRLNNISYISFKNLTIRGTFTNAWPVHFFGSTACNNDTIKNCIIDFGSTPVSSFNSTNYIGLVFSGNATSYTTTGNFSNNAVDSNTILGGYANITVYCNNTAANGGNSFTRNSCNNAYQYGMYFSGINGAVIDKNTIDLNTNSISSTGLYITGSNALAATNTWLISRNKITNMGQYGIYLSNSSGFSSNRGNLVNNSIGGGFRNTNPVGMYLYYYVSINKYWNIFHNSVNIDNVATVAGASCIYSYSCCNSSTADNFDFRNNILAVTNPASVATVFETPNWGYSYSFPNAASFNYNLFFKAGAGPSTVIANNAGTPIPMSTLIGNGGYNTNSIIADPGFSSSTNLLPYNACNNGTNIASVTTDLNGTSRGATPDMGAYEVTPSANDIGVASITGPAIPFSAGLQNITVLLRNYGSTTVTSANVSYSVNGGTPVTAVFTGSIAPCSTATYTFTGANQYNFAASTSYNIKCFASAPNGVADGNALNDTATVPVIFTGMSGVFTIDSSLANSATNFQNFTSAVSALNSGGVNGPVVFNVLTGTYNEQVIIQAPGASATNTVTFDGGNGNAATRILTFAGNTSNPSTLRLNGCSFVTLRNITITTTGTSEGWGVNFFNATNCRLNNCVVNVSGNGATSTSSNFQGININAGAANSSYSAASSVANNNTVDSCTINAGYFNIYTSISNGNLVNYFNYNTLNNAYQYAGYFNSAQTVKFNNNIVNLRTTSTTNYGLYYINCNPTGTSYHEIRNNKITNAGQYGIYFTSSSGSGSAFGQIYNNMIGGGFRSTGGYNGIYTNSSNYQIWNNSFNLDFASTSGTTAAIYLAGGNNNNIQNNHFVVSSTTAFNAYSLYTGASSYISLLNNNNYYNRSSSALLNIGGTNYTVGNFRTAFPSGGGVNSINLDPFYISATNLHTTAPCNNGVNLGLTTDIDGETRSTTPDIGADEVVTLASNDIGVFKINSPNFPLSTGLQSINVTLRNYGGNTVTSANIDYTVNGGFPTSQTWLGSMAPCDTVNFTFIVPYTFTTGLTNLKVYSSVPNGIADANAANDTAQFTLSPALSGSYTIDPAGSGPTNYLRFGAADSALMSGGISGPVTFDVAAGTYNEQVSIPSTINGSSNANSITFQSATGLASSVILSYSATAANNYTLRLSGINNVKFRNLTISATNINYGTALSIINNASSDSFYNVVFNGVVTTSNTTSHAVIYCPSPTISNNIYFDTCRINNGAYGSYFTSNSSSTLGTTSQNVGFNNCDFVNQYAYGMYNQYLDGFKITKNRITTNSAYTSYYGMYNYWIMVLANVSKPVCTGNRIWGAAGGYGMYNYYIGVNSTINAINKPIFANNMIQIGSGANSTYGLYDAYSYTADYVNNSVNIGCTQTANTSAAAWFQASNNNLSTIQNNIFAAYNGAPAIRLDAAAGYPTINYNDYYTTGTNLGYITTTAYTTLAALKTATSKDANSVNVNPNYVSTTDLHISTATNVLSIIANPLALTDYDNTVRCATTDIGADHHPATNNIGISSIAYPFGGVAGAGTRDVKAYIKNYGSNVITSANVRYTDNIITRSVAWTGVLNPCDSVLVTFTGTGQYTFSGAWSLKFYTDSPNTVIDTDRLNDTLQSSGCTGLAGVYTIDPAGSGGTNYTSFALAIAAMQVCGIGGPTTFNVAAATYNEQVSIPNINGTSPINTLTFDGGNGNASSRILTFATTNAAPHVLRFNNSKYVIFRNITIRSTGTTDAWVAHFLDGNNNRLNNCVVEITGAGATSTNSNMAAVVVNGNATSMGTASTLSNNNSIDSCTLNAGYYSVYASINANSNTLNVNSSALNSAYYYGFYGINTFALRLKGNTINLRTTTTSNQPVYLQSLNNSGTDYFEISGNRIPNPGQFGIYLNSCSNSGSEYNKIFNNMIGGGFRYTSSSYGIYLTSCSRTQVVHNNINFDIATTSGTSAAIYIANGGTNEVRNNHMSVSTPTAISAYPLYISPASAVTTCDNNNYYNRSSSNLLNIAGTNYTLSTFRNAFPSGGGVSSVNVNPSYMAGLDLHVNDGCNNGIQIAGYTTDIDGQTRNNPPDIGADEVVALNNDAGTVSIAPFGPGLQNVKVVIKNFGGNTITSSTVSYMVNGGTAKIMTWTGSLAPCDTTTVTFTGANQYNFSLGTSYTIVAYTSNPNTSTDPKSSNDTTTFGPSCTMLSGIYTINPAGSGPMNFTSFTTAVAALNCGGVSSPVTFRVAAGTYNEQITISSIPGVSAANNVVFDGDTASSRIITFSPSLNTQAHTIRFDGAQYVGIRNLTIENTGASFGVGVHIMGNSNFAKVKNCIIQLTGAAATSTSNYYIPVLMNNYNDIYSVTSVGTQVANVEIDSNRMINGYYGVYVWSVTGTPYASNIQLRKNIIDSSYYYGTYFYYTDGITYSNNTVNMRIAGSTNSMGLYLNTCFSTASNIHTITGNKIINAGQYGMNINQSYNNFNSSRCRLINNMIGGGFRINSAYGIYCANLNYWDMWNNSVNLDYPVTSSTYATMYIVNGSSHDVRNNMLVYSAASGGGVPFYASTGTILSSLDYNNYYNASGSSLVLLGANSYTASNYINGGGFNATSKNQNPGFVSSKDLHIGSACLNGTQIASVTTDFDGQSRNNPPDMGADEFTGVVNNDIGVSYLIAPSSPFIAGTQDVKVRIVNNGANTVTSATVKYAVNGGLPKSITWSGSLLPCDTTSVTFTGANQFTFAFGSSYAIKAYTEQPNSVTDPNRNNDTLISTVCPAFSGAFTINPGGSGPNNFTSFNAAVSAISCGGLSGPVTFSVATGTYNEQINLNAINGASAINTVTFRSATNIASNVVLSFNSTGTADNYIAMLNGCSYVKFANITFAPLGVNYGNAVVITNSANFNTIDSCVFNGLNTSSATSNLALIYSNGTKDNNNSISNSGFNNASMGIYWYSNSSSYAAGNQILKNTFINQYYSAIYTSYHDYLRISQNSISTSTGYTNYYGIFEQYTFNTSGASQITRNKIIATIAGGYGIYNYYPNMGGNSTNRFLVANNMIQINTTSTSTSYGMIDYYSYYIDVLHNTINVSGQAGGTSYAFYNNYFYSSTCFVQNNVFVNSTVGAGANSFAVAEYLSSAGTWNNNNYYSTGTNLGQWSGVSKATLALWQAAGSQDALSYSRLPIFTSPTDLHFYNLPCLNNAGANVLAKVGDDYDGTARTATPDIGATEFVPLALDAAAIAVRAPSGALSIGTPYNVVVTVSNMGTTVVNSVVVGYRVNGGAAVSRTLTALTLNPCDTLQVTFNATSGPGSTDQRYFALAGLVSVKAFTAVPNAGTDLNAINDTTTVTFCTPFSGSFTINGSLPASSTNFQSFTDAKNALTSCGGITGPVIFSVAAGTYNEQIDLTAIPGASATNTVTFDGGAGNASTRILNYSFAASNSLHTFRVNNAQYINLQNITIRGGNGTYGWPLHIYGSSSNIKVKNCVIDFVGNGLNATNDNFDPIVVNNYAASASPTAGTWTGTNIEIDSNRILGGNASIYIYGNGSNTGVYFRNNRADSAYTYGAYVYNLPVMKINNNTFNMRFAGSINSYGMYLNNCNSSVSNYHEVNGNKIINCGYYGIYLTGSNGQAAPRSQMFNNAIGGGFRNSNPSGINFASSSYNWDVWHNSINMDNQATGANSAALFVGQCCTTGSTLLDVRNNIFAVTTAGSSSYPIYFSNGTNYAVRSTLAWNYNIYYKAGITNTQPFLYVAGTQTIANFIGNGGYNLNSISQNPNFVGAKDLHVFDGCFNGDSLGVTNDIDGNLRASYGDRGASEVVSASDDIGAKVLLQPSVPISPGLQDIRVIVKNYGNNTVYNGTVKYSVNGGTPVSMVFADTITPCDTSLVTFTGAQQYNFIAGNTYTIRVYTELPNGNADSYRGNDTIGVGPVCVGMSGIFTINPSGSGSSNFTTFANAINALLCGGVAGPTIFNVAAGTYAEQITVPTIPGASLSNQVIFDGGAGNAATRILVNNTTTQSTSHTLRMTNASFIQFNNLTIRSTGTSYAWPVHLFGTCNNIKLRNNIIEITGTGATGTSNSFVPVVMSGSTTSATTNTQQDSIEIDSNIINGGYASIWDYNNAGTANRFRGNTLNNPIWYGIYVYNSTEVKAKNNIINMSPTGNIASMGIYLFVSSPTGSMQHEISGNKIFDMGQYGIYVSNSYGLFANPSMIVNNMISGFRNTSAHYGIAFDYASYFNVWFNSIISDTATSSANGNIHITNSNSMNVRNNIMMVNAVGSQQMPFYAGTAANVSALDYNNYYKTGSFTNLIYVGANYTASNYIGGSGFNMNSLSRDPYFVSRRNLHIGNGCNNGVTIAGVNTDIDGNTRNTPPDVGADEMIGGVSNNLGVTSIVSPSVPFVTGLQNVSVIVSNLGNNLVTSYDVSYSVNGGAPVLVSMIDSILPCDTSLVVFTGTNQYNFTGGGPYSVKAYTALPNGLSDNNRLDDTTTIGPLCPAMNGAYTINPAGSGSTNFTSFNAAVSALQCGGVSGNVTFTVSNGTYTEQVNIGSIAGVNDTMRVTFQGTSQAGTILTYNAGIATSAHTLRLNNSPYINFYNMTIQAGGPTYGAAVHIFGASNYSKVKQCVIAISGASANSTSNYFIPVLINNSTDITNPALNGTMVNNLEIDSNRIVAGYYGIYIYGRTSTPYAGNNKFRKNTIDSSYYYGFYAYYIEAIKFLNNTVNIRALGTTNSQGLSLNNCYNNGSSYHEIVANRIANAGQYGMYIYFASNSASYRGKMVNNMVGGGFRTSSAYGIYMAWSDYWDVWNNTVNLDFATSSSTYAAFSNSVYTNLDIRNNHFAYTAASGSGLPFYSSTTVTSLNYNNYYNAASANLVYVNGTTYTSSTYVGGGGYNANSVSGSAAFVSPTNLHLTASGLKGTAITAVTNDIDGEIRNTPPDLGADEYYSAMDIGVFAIDTPSNVTFCGRSRNIIVRLRNYGNQPVSLATINININGSFITSYTWVGSLGIGATSAQINVGSYTFSGGAYSLSASTSSPNGGADINNANDTSTNSFSVTPSVFPSITITTPNTSVCSGTSVTFTAAYSAGGPLPAFQWRKNGITVGTNDTFYTNGALVNNDSIVCLLTSTATCATPSIVVSNSLKMNIGTTLPPSVTIAAASSSVCPGQTVSLTATPLNGGTAPHYQWIKNGVNVGTDSAFYSFTSPVNNDSIRCILTSSLSCASKPRDTSNFVKITVNPFLTPTVGITASLTTLCAGVTDTFTASITNGGAAPVYAWKKNSGTSIGTNSSTLAISTLNNNDSVYLVLTSNATCANPAIVTSNKIAVTVNPSVLPTAVVTASKNTMCNGDSVKFKAITTNGGTSPIKQWMKNGSPLVSGIDSFTTSLLLNKDTVYLVYTSNANCAIPPTVTSNKQVITVNPVVTPSVTMSANNNNICSGSSVQFTAIPVNGGTTPHYAWKRNGINVGTDSIRFTTSNLFNNDSVYVILTSNATCASKTLDTAKAVKLTVNNVVTPSVSVTANATSFCLGIPVTFTAAITNGGTTPHYQWKKNGVNIGTDSSVFTASSFNDKDTVYVVLTSNATCASAPTATSNKTILNVTVPVSTSVAISPSANNVCQGTVITFSATPVNPGTTPLYQWKINGNNAGPNAATFITASLNNSDTVLLEMTSSLGCAVPAKAVSNKVTMQITPSVTPKVSVSQSATNVCSGTTVTFTALDSSGGSLPVHKWYVNGTQLGSDSLKFTTPVSFGNTIKCVLQSNATCKTKTYDTAVSNIVIKALPVKPVITKSNDTIMSTVSAGYQWYLNNSIISGATARIFKVIQNGSYKVTVDSLGCTNTSDPFAVTGVGIKTVLSDDYINIAPNPTSNNLLLNAQFETSDETIITVFDVSGKQVFELSKGKVNTLSDEMIDLSNFRSGIYLVMIKHGDSVSKRKIVKAD